MSYETSTEEQPQVIRATRARQGSWGRHILWVLIISTVLAALVLLGSWAMHADQLRGQGGQTAVKDAPTVAQTSQTVQQPRIADTDPASPGR